jgi:hypothetical protein
MKTPCGSILSKSVIAILILNEGLAPGQINVRDFGATGDGTTDDTEAIQKACDAVHGRSQPYPGAGFGAYYTGISPVIFPTGQYRITDTIELRNNGNFRGEGAVIHQTTPGKDIFKYTNAWRMSFEGFTFLEGRNHLVLHNPNIDTGLIRIDDCKFYGASGVAIDFQTQSTMLNIEDCVFLHCMQALTIIGGGDQTVMRDCWITSHKDMKDMAVIVNKGGRLTIDNLLGVPLVNGRDQRWIDNYGQWLSCVQCRFGGEGGGFTPVVNYAKPKPYPLGTMVFIEDSLICSAGNPKRKCAVYCEEIPNWLVVRDNNLYVTEVQVRPDIDPNTYFAGIKKQMLRFDISNNCNADRGDLPAWLRDPPTASGPPIPTLSADATSTALQEAADTISALPLPVEPPFETNGHRQQTDPSAFVSILPADHPWALDEKMDGTMLFNSDFLAVATHDEGSIIMRRRPGKNSWPHAVSRSITIDLDKTPILTWKVQDLGRGTADATAVKVIDREEQRMAVLGEFMAGFYQYRAFDLRKALDLSGTRILDIKFYYLGDAWKHPKPTEMGDYIYLQFLRTEAPNPPSSE